MSSFLSRYRRTRGFGVHSPFAYRLITEVLTEQPEVYYAYPEINSLCPRSHRSRYPEIYRGVNFSAPEARMLFRLMCFLNPKNVAEIGNGFEVTHLIFSRAIPKAKVRRWISSRAELLPQGEKNFILVNETRPEVNDQILSYLTASVRNGSVVMLRNISVIAAMRELWEKLRGALPEFGMTFYSDHAAVIIGDKKLPRQDFNINLPL